MKTLSALGVLAGGFLFQPTPRAVVTTLLCLASRAHRMHPAVAALVLVLIVATWGNDDA